ncbi:phage tail assembly protein [Burkholderia cepacia]|uniref:phage tail assembly protein n=1 Tax=Burkholderia cepacia TaxID=292 RepID=UPI0015896E91|nr:phage tail assembly protein [Burkholderia cepacia]
MEGQQKKPRKQQPPMLTISLGTPITLKGAAGAGDDVHTEIELREPDFGQIQRFVKTVSAKGALAALRELISEQSTIPALGIDKITASEFYKAQEYLLYFLSPPDEDDPEGNGEGSQ